MDTSSRHAAESRQFRPQQRGARHACRCWHGTGLLGGRPYLGLWSVFVLDNGLGDEDISYVDLAGSYDVLAESGHNWTWALYTAPTLGGTYTISALTETNTSNATYAATLTPPAGTKVLGLLLKCAAGSHSVAAEKYVYFTTVDIYSNSRTTKPRIDEAMVTLATRSGLATSIVSLPVGAPRDDLHIGDNGALTTAADGMKLLEELHAQPFERAFWNDKTFYCRPIPETPENDARVIVVGGGNPGLESWDVTLTDEYSPQYVCVKFGNLDDATLPEGYVRRLYRPSIPPDNADLRIETVDYSSLILPDAAAAALANNLLGMQTGSEIPQGQIFDANPLFADAGERWGNNIDPTSVYQDHYSNLVSGTLSGFAYTTASGWAGSNSPTDPVCLVGDGVNDYVDFGDVSACNFGTGAFSVRKWLKLDALPAAGTMDVSVGKLDGDWGWYLGVTPTGKLRGYVGGSGAAPPTAPVASGAVTTTVDGAYTVHKFTGNGTLTVPDGAPPITATVLVVGGGGAGGPAGGLGASGGGGAGGYDTGAETLVGTMPVVVGAGGSASDGTGSSFGTRSVGGGGYDTGNVTGASGAGGYSSDAGTGDFGTLNIGGFGNDGGRGANSQTYGAGGGGGGASADGGNGGAAAAGAGGAGLNSDIVLAGTPVGYAGGGGGGRHYSSGGGTASHGGGAGGYIGLAAVAGTANTGGGGGGNEHSAAGANGGSGVVVVRYLTPTATVNCRQQTGATTLSVGTLYHCTMTYAGSGGDIALYVNGVSEALTAAGSLGAWDVSTTGNLQLFKHGSDYLSGALGRVTAWSHELTSAEVLVDVAASEVYAGRSLAKGTIVLRGTCRTRTGTTVPAHHIRAGWWIQNLEWLPDPTQLPPTLFITDYSVDLADRKVALTIGDDSMEELIGVRLAELLSIPASTSTEYSVSEDTTTSSPDEWVSDTFTVPDSGPTPIGPPPPVGPPPGVDPDYPRPPVTPPYIGPGKG